MYIRNTILALVAAFCCTFAQGSVSVGSNTVSAAYYGTNVCSAMWYGTNLVATWGVALPYDAEVEYLESTGTQYIDTMWFATADDVRIEAEFSSLASDNVVWGSETYDTYINWCMNQYRGNWYCGTTTPFSMPVNAFDGNKHSVDMSATNGVFFGYIDATSFSFAYSGTIVNASGVKNLYLYADGINGVAYNVSPARIYFLKIYDYGVLQRSFVPVRVGSVGYMYDRVSKQLFGNSGTGNFVVGPDK